jgi:hypothetical protein
LVETRTRPTDAVSVNLDAGGRKTP